MDRVNAVEGVVLQVEINVLIWVLTSAVALDNRVSVVTISSYDLNDISLQKRLFAGFIEREPA